jgi:DNA-binding MarR family transcriptional regulator
MPPDRGKLEALLEEINALSILLKKRGPERTQPALPSAARSVLAVLKRSGPMTVPALGRVRGTSRQNIQGIVNRLKAEGCVHLAPNPAHKKSELVSATERGLSLLEKNDNSNSRHLDALLAQFSEEELVLISGLLRRLREVLAADEMTPERNKEVSKAKKHQAKRIAFPEYQVEEELPVNLL